MKKRIYVLAAIMAAGSLSACSPKTTEQNPSASQVQEETSAEFEESTVSEEENEILKEESEGQEDTENSLTSSDEKLNEIYQAVKEAYGDDYVHQMAVDSEILESVYGIDGSWYEACIAETPMISVNVETFMGFKAVSGHEKDIAEALNTYKSKQLSDSVQYPMNLPKIQAAKVLEEDGYVFFVMLGSPDMEAEEKGEEDALKSAEEKNQIGIDTVESFFK